MKSSVGWVTIGRVIGTIMSSFPFWAHEPIS